MKKFELPFLAWSVAPLLFSIGYFCIHLLDEDGLAASLLRENGPVENTQAFVMAICIGIGVYILKKFPKDKPKWIFYWIVLATVCSVYVCGEEISWGQQFFRWHTPTGWAAMNDHDETNLHNSSKWFDQFPKTTLELSCYTGGLFIPLLKKYKLGFLPIKFEIVYPTALFAITAICILFFRITKPLDRAFHIFDYSRLSEVKEMLMYWFVFMYLWLLKNRILKASA